jgi:hypothetical protein
MPVHSVSSPSARLQQVDPTDRWLQGDGTRCVNCPACRRGGHRANLHPDTAFAGCRVETKLRVEEVHVGDGHAEGGRTTTLAPLSSFSSPQPQGSRCRRHLPRPIMGGPCWAGRATHQGGRTDSDRGMVGLLTAAGISRSRVAPPSLRLPPRQPAQNGIASSGEPSSARESACRQFSGSSAKALFVSRYQPDNVRQA